MLTFTFHKRNKQLVKTKCTVYVTDTMYWIRMAIIDVHWNNWHLPETCVLQALAHTPVSITL